MYPESKSLVLVKTESTYGTDPTPTQAANAILTKGLPSFKPTGSARMRDVAKPWYGSIPGVNVGEGITISFTTELRGYGVADNGATRLDPLLRAANLTQTISGLDYVYTPNSTMEGESCTVWFYHNGAKHVINGAVVSSMKITAKTNEIITIDWELTGLYSSSAVAAATWPSSITYGDAADPLIFRSASFVYNSVTSLVIDTLELTLTNTVGKRTDANDATGISRYFISNREIKGSFDPEIVAVGTFDPYSLFDASTEAASTFQFGTLDNYKLEVSIPKCVIDVPEISTRESILTYGINFTAHTDLTTGNNEITLTFPGAVA